MTQPAGSLTYNNYELLLHGLTYGVTDNVQASVTVLAPIVRDMPFVGFAALKARLAATERLHLAVQGSAAFGHAFDSSSGNPNGYSVGAGAYASFCLRDDCSSLFNASANYQYGTATGDGGGGHLLIYGGSIVHRVASHVKVLAEVTSAAGKSGSKDLDNISGIFNTGKPLTGAVPLRYRPKKLYQIFPTHSTKKCGLTAREKRFDNVTKPFD